MKSIVQRALEDDEFALLELIDHILENKLSNHHFEQIVNSEKNFEKKVALLALISACTDRIPLDQGKEYFNVIANMDDPICKTIAASAIFNLTTDNDRRIEASQMLNSALRSSFILPVYVSLVSDLAYEFFNYKAIRNESNEIDFLILVQTAQKMFPLLPEGMQKNLLERLEQYFPQLIKDSLDHFRVAQFYDSIGEDIKMYQHYHQAIELDKTPKYEKKLIKKIEQRINSRSSFWKQSLDSSLLKRWNKKNNFLIEKLNQKLDNCYINREFLEDIKDELSKVKVYKDNIHICFFNLQQKMSTQSQHYLYNEISEQISNIDHLDSRIDDIVDLISINELENSTGMPKFRI